MIIVPNLRVKMAERGITIKEVHEKTNLSRTTISNLYNGNSDGIKFETLEKLCGLLNCTPNDLLKIVTIDVGALNFSKVTENKLHNYIEFLATCNVNINDITKKIETSIIADTEFLDEYDFFVGTIYLKDSYIVSEDEFSISSNNIDKVNKSLEKYLLSQFTISSISEEQFGVPPDIKYSF